MSKLRLDYLFSIDPLIANCLIYGRPLIEYSLYSQKPTLAAAKCKAVL